jgi:hypothetical protein
MEATMLKLAVLMGGLSLVSSFVAPTPSLMASVKAATPTACTMARADYDYSAHMRPAIYAYTEETSLDRDLENYSTQTEAWIIQMSDVTCDAGTRSPDGLVCYQWDSSISEALPVGWGCSTWTGVGRHWAITPSGGWQKIGGTDFSVSLRAGIRPQMGRDSCEEWEYWDDSLQQCVSANTPIIIPLTRSQNFKLTNTAGGVAFDHNGDGVLEQTAWTAGDSKLAFLAIDRNGNGFIDSGKELFGNHTVPGMRHGFDALNAMNLGMGGDEVGIIDSTQPIFSKLLLWEDANHNGAAEPHELQPASNLLSGIGLGLKPHNRRDGHGNRFALQGFAHVRSKPGRNFPESPADDRARGIKIYDVVFTNR